MQEGCEIQKFTMQFEDSVIDSKNNSENQGPQIKNHSVFVKEIDYQFQKLLLQLTSSKIPENSLFEVDSLIQKLSVSLLLQITNGPNILFTLYQILSVRKPTIIRHYPFCPISVIILRIRTLIKRVKKHLLNKLGFKKKSKRLPKKIIQSSFHHYVREKSIEIRIYDVSNTELQHPPLVKTKPIIFIQEPLLI